MANKDRLINEIISVFINNINSDLESIKEIRNIVLAKHNYILPDYTIKSRNTIKTLEKALHNYYQEKHNKVD